MLDEDILIGQTVKAMYINANKTEILLDCGGSWFSLITEGDCCSESWIEHITDPSDLIGSVITGLERIDIGTAIPTRQDEDRLYAFSILYSGKYSRKFQIEFRNSSNGYYGGEMEVYQTEKNLTGFRPLSEAF